MIQTYRSDSNWFCWREGNADVIQKAEKATRQARSGYQELKSQPRTLRTIFIFWQLLKIAGHKPAPFNSSRIFEAITSALGDPRDGSPLTASQLTPPSFTPAFRAASLIAFVCSSGIAPPNTTARGILRSCEGRSTLLPIFDTGVIASPPSTAGISVTPDLSDKRQQWTTVFTMRAIRICSSGQGGLTVVFWCQELRELF